MKKMLLIILSLAVLFQACEFDLGTDDLFDGFGDYRDYESQEYVYDIGYSSYLACEGADESGVSKASPARNFNGTVTVNNPQGNGTADVTGTITINGDSTGNADLSITFNDWESATGTLNGSGTFKADITLEATALVTAAVVTGDYTIDSNTINSTNLNFGIFESFSGGTNYSADGNAVINGEDETFSFSY